MSRSLHVLLMAGAALAISVPAAAQDFGKRGSERVGRQLAAERGEAPLREEGQAARREARRQAPDAAPSRFVAAPQAQSQGQPQAPASVGSVIGQSVQRSVAAESHTRPSWRRGDRDGDGVPNRRDIDRGGDGRPNWRDRDSNNDGRVDNRWRDRDRDGIPNGRDRDIDNDGRPNWRDRDRDGIPNHRDWDRDGDGKPNWRDGNKRHDPWRYWHRPRPSYVIVRPSPSYRYHPYWWGSSLFLFDDRYDRYGYDYGAYYRPGYGFYGAQLGSGWATLYPWLRQDPAARHWVMWNFDDNRNGRLGKDEARDANRAFDRLADRNRDGRISDREVRWAIDELRDEFRYSYRDGY